MADNVLDIWIYLAETPLLWLTVTLVVYMAAEWLSATLKRNPLANPVVLTAAVLIVLLHFTGTDYKTYFDGAQFVHFLLGPATVALAVPLYHNIGIVKKALLPMGAALFAGSVTAAGSAVGIAWLMGAPPELLASLAPKSATTPIAMELARNLGGIASLTAVLVIFTGMTGAIIVTPTMNLLGIRDFAARGFAVGVASHGIGTARAFQVSELAGTFAGIAMGLNGALTSLLVLIWIAFHV